MLKSLFKFLFTSKENCPLRHVNCNLPPKSEAELNTVYNFTSPVFWNTSDPVKVTEIVENLTPLLGGGVHFGDNLLTWSKNLSMLDDKNFLDSWRSNAESPADQAIVWRRYVLVCAAYHCIHLEGDFVECGAYTGVGVKTVVDYLGGPGFPKDFWAYDMFEHSDQMLNHAMPDHSPELFDRVRRKFIDYPKVHVIRGLIPNVFATVCPEKISYLHIDLNQAPAEIAALELLFPKIVPGGIVILDDYEWGGTYRAQKIAEDEWFDQRMYRVIPLPTGQGLVIKR